MNHWITLVGHLTKEAEYQLPADGAKVLHVVLRAVLVLGKNESFKISVESDFMSRLKVNLS